MILAGDYGGIVLFEFDFLLHVIMILVNCGHVCCSRIVSQVAFCWCPLYKLRSRDCFAAIGGV